MKQKNLNKCMIIVMIAVFSFLGIYITNYDSGLTDEVVSEEVLTPEEMPDVSKGFGTYDNAVDCFLASSVVMDNTVDYERHVDATISAKAAFITVNQKVTNHVSVDKDGTVYFEEITMAESSYSNSTAVRAIQKNKETIDVEGTNNFDSSGKAVYTGNYSTITTTEYQNIHGCLPLENIYVISNKTIKKVNSFEFDGEYYRFSAELKTIAPKTPYKEKIKRAADASKMVFTSCNVEVVIDKNGLVHTFNINETYSLTVGVTAEVTSTLKIVYNYN